MPYRPRSLVRIPLVFAGEPPTTLLRDEKGRPHEHTIVDAEPLGDGRFAAELWTILELGSGEGRRLSLWASGPPRAAAAGATSPAELSNGTLVVSLEPSSGIASLRSGDLEVAGSDFLSSFVSYRSADAVDVHPNQPWELRTEPAGEGLRRARLRTRIPFATPEDGEVAATVEVTLSLPSGVPWLVADVEVAYPYTTKRDVLHNPSQKLRRLLDRRCVEVAPFQLHPRLSGNREDPLRVWKHNYLGVTSHYDLDYARINPKNAEIDAFNHQVTAGWVAVSDGDRGLLVAEDADVRASFTFAPMRLREEDGRQALWLNPFGSYHGRQLDYSQSDGTGVGAEVTELSSSALHPNGPSYNGQRERFSLLLAPYAGDAPPTGCSAMPAASSLRPQWST